MNVCVAIHPAYDFEQDGNPRKWLIFKLVGSEELESPTSCL
jgi:hypothetical protein